jgi:predicted CoA-binding protein
MKRNERTVVVLGASDKPGRYSNRAVRLLKAEGYRVIPVHPTLDKVEGLDVRHDLAEIREPVDTLTVYLSPDRCLPLMESIQRRKPARVIFNPGTESKTLEDGLNSAGIPFVRACTLVMLNTGQF